MTAEEHPATSPAHVWSPITDLTDDDLDARSDELPRLADVWREENASLADDAALRRFNERLHREWAIETGVIERIYTLDRGTTRLLIEHGIDPALIPDDATDKPPELVAQVIQDQESAVDFLFDFVGKKRTLSIGSIKEIHALMTKHQETTTGIDQFGRKFEIPLEHGEFKSRRNDPTRPDGRLHEYCPPVHVQQEMEHLLDMHAEHVRRSISPEVESAWLHHRFTQIHPFQDGNGRVARALASLVFISAGWFPLVITRDERTSYLHALEVADRNGLRALVELFSLRQRKAFVAALGIAREVVQEGQRIDQQLAAIADMFERRDEAVRAELDQAKDIAGAMWVRASERFDELATRLEVSISAGSNERRVFTDSASNEDIGKKFWHRWQIVQTARELEYYAGLRGFACWVRLCIETESGRSEILLSLHEIGPEYRGVIGGSMSFYRRQESADGERHAVDVQAVSEDAFQINYKDSVGEVGQRFERWMDRGLVRALDAWRRSE